MFTHRFQIVVETTGKLLQKQARGKASKILDKLHDVLSLITCIPVITANDIMGIVSSMGIAIISLQYIIR